MKTIGLIGGMSWQSTQDYYRIMNECVAKRMGGLHSAEILMYSIDFTLVERLQAQGEWGRLAVLLGLIGYKLQIAGAELLLIATNTMHVVAEDIEERSSIPLLHIADATGEAVAAASMQTVGLLGTRFTMEKSFYRDRLAERFGLEVVIPEEDDRQTMHRIIYDELCIGKLEDDSWQQIRDISERLAKRGAEGIILGCTELPMLIRPDDVSIPLFDTTRIHAEAAIAKALVN